MPAEPAAALDASANPHLGAVVSLPDFIALAGTLSDAERRTIVNQALVLIDDVYVHLPLKRAAHAVDPVQQLKLLRRRLGTLSERQFHDEMINIFKRLRDLHTNYILPTPYNQHTAFLPFLMEEFYDNAGKRHYIVTRLILGFTHPTFVPGVEVTRWSGVPIDRAVEINADREAGSNEAARHVRGLDNMTVRPMVMSLPPDAEWVDVGYRSGSSELEVRLPWQVFRPDPEPGGDAGTPDAASDLVRTSLGLDLELAMTNLARKHLFAPDVIDRQDQAAAIRTAGGAVSGRRYPGPVVLITDARCYSTTDFFAAGFQDNRLGPILGVDGNTGAGGANVFTHSMLRDVLPGRGSPFKPLPNGAGMRVAIRASTRVGERAGLPLEDLGVEPDAIHRLTRRDLLEDNVDLIDEAGRILASGV